jgi:hypothetical protein
MAPGEKEGKTRKKKKKKKKKEIMAAQRCLV